MNVPSRLFRQGADDEAAIDMPNAGDTAVFPKAIEKEALRGAGRRGRVPAMKDMKPTRLKSLRILSLLLLVPGVAGLLFSACLSTYYVETLPRTPDPMEERLVPREIHGITVFETENEDRKLRFYEFSSLGTFLVGMVLGAIYLERWAAARGGETPQPRWREPRRPGRSRWPC